MIRVFANNTDITESVEYNTLKITRQANNRRDTASFSSLTEIAEATEVEIYKGSTLVVSGTLAVGSVSITLESADHIRKNLFRVGDRIIIDPETANMEFVTVTSISGKTIGISATRYTHADKAFVCKKLFGGIVLKTPRKEIHTSEVVIWEVSAVDYSKVLDQEAIVDTYEDMYPREIIGRAVYKFTADDITSEITDAETLTGWIASGVAREPVLNGSNRIYKNQSISTGASGAGTGKVRHYIAPRPFDGNFDEGGLNGEVGLINRTFERPIVASHTYLNTMTTAQRDDFMWRWGGNTTLNPSFTGPVVLPNGSAFGNPTSLHGIQCLGLQDDAYIEGDFYIGNAGTYNFAWYDAYRSYGGANSYTIYIDGVSQGTFTPSGTGWTDRYFGLTLTKGQHTIKIQGTLAGDKTTFLDRLQFTIALSTPLMNWRTENPYLVSMPVDKGVNGGRCMKISLQPGEYREVFSHFVGYFGPGGYTMKPNTKYLISGYMKVSGSGNMGDFGAEFGILGTQSGGGADWFFGASDRVKGDTGGWQYYEKEFTTPANANNAHSVCNFYNHGSSTFTGDVYFDQINISEVSDFSAYDKLRFWNYQKNYIEDEYSSIKFRIGKGSSYFEWDAVMAGDVWSYESGAFSEARIVGTPNKNDITFFEIEFTALRSSATGSLLIDHIFMGKNGFTIRNTERGNVVAKDVRAQYKKPASFIENIAKTNGFFWYVDYFRDINFFANNSRTAPFSLSNVSTNFSNLKITADITNLKNRQTVRGGQSPSEFLYDQEKVVDGIETSYRLDYKPKTLQIYVDTGSGYVLKTSGIENIVAESTVDFVFNFNEKTVRNASIATLSAGTKIKFVYYPYRDIRVQVQDSDSIARMKSLIGGRGIFDGEVINDESIKTFDDARARAMAELKAYANPIITGTFTTEESGLDVGQVLHITDPQYATDEDFLVQKVNISFRGIDFNPVYSVESGSTLFGLIEFFQILLKRSAKDSVDVSELVDVVYTVDEVMIIGDAVTKRKKAPPFYAHSRTGNYSYTLTLTEGGTTLDAYADFCQAG